MKVNFESLKESISDTLIATPLNLVLNYFLLMFCLWLEMGALSMSFFMTGVFFVLAVVRKYYVRQWFKKREVERERE